MTEIAVAVTDPGGRRFSRAAITIRATVSTTSCGNKQ